MIIRLLMNYFSRAFGRQKSSASEEGPSSVTTATPFSATSVEKKNLYAQASIFQQQGKFNEAEAIYRALLRKHPKDIDLLLSLGTLHMQCSSFLKAAHLLKQAIAIDSNNATALDALGKSLNCLHQHDEALVCYGKLLALQPNNADAFSNYGATLQYLKRSEQSLESYNRALAIDPDHVIALENRGTILQQLERFEDALASYDRALTLQPDRADTHNNRGAVLQKLGRHEEALSSHGSAIAINANHASALYNRGKLLMERGRNAEAIGDFRKAIALDGNNAQAHNNLSCVLREQNQLAAAEYHLMQAIRINPEFANFHYNLATLSISQGKLADAIRHFGDALKCSPDHCAARSFMLHLMQKTCQWEALESNIAQLRHNMSHTSKTPESFVSPFIFMSMPGTTLEEHKVCAEKWAQSEYQAASSQRHALGFNHNRSRRGKIIIGYLSADFREHPVPRVIAQVFELHNRDQFHIIAYSYAPDDGSDIRKRLQGAFDKFVDIQTYSDIDAARQIYADNVNILVDLTGHTENSRSRILAFRPAPIQLNYLGYETTMGADFIDYLVADRFLVPPEYQRYYTEKLLYLPNCFMPADRTRPRPPAPDRASCGLTDGDFVFCCFNQTFKITPAVFDVWCRLLSSIPNSILWLLASNPFAEQNLKRESLKESDFAS